MDSRFEILRNKITAPHPVPRIEGRRADAMKIIDYLRENYPAERDYLYDLYDAVNKYDDLSDGELKYISQLRLQQESFSEIVSNLKKRFSIHYIGVIKKRAEAIDNVSEIIMFTEDLRK